MGQQEAACLLTQEMVEVRVSSLKGAQFKILSSLASLCVLALGNMTYGFTKILHEEFRFKAHSREMWSKAGFVEGVSQLTQGQTWEWSPYR